MYTVAPPPSLPNPHCGRGLLTPPLESPCPLKAGYLSIQSLLSQQDLSHSQHHKCTPLIRQRFLRWGKYGGGSSQNSPTDPLIPRNPQPEKEKNLIFCLNLKKQKTFKSPCRKKNQLLLVVIEGSEGGVEKGASNSRRPSRRPLIGQVGGAPLYKPLNDKEASAWGEMRDGRPSGGAG